jgi:hypothetical protein
MTYIQWVSITECESRYQRRAPMPWESNHKPAESPRKPAWMTNRTPQLKTEGEGTLKAVDEALLGYERGRKQETFEAVLDAFGNWRDSAAYREMDRDSVRKAAVKPAISEMKDWLKAEYLWWMRYAQRDVLADFSLAAQTLIKAFPTMPELYKNALQETFVNSGITSEKIYCLKWYPDLDSWKKRLAELGANSTLAEGANAFTASWGDTVPRCRTEHKHWVAPFNRAVEFHTHSRDSFTHELLHWCTHESVKLYIEDNYKKRGRDYTFLKEGLTEWLKRFATGDRAKGNYPADHDSAVEVGKRLGITELEVAEMYLGGRNFATMCTELAKTNDSMWSEKLTAGMSTSTSTYEVSTYNQVLSLFSQGRPSIKMKGPNMEKERNLTETMYKGFLANNLTPEQVQEKTNQRWADGYRIWKQGK